MPRVVKSKSAISSTSSSSSPNFALLFLGLPGHVFVTLRYRIPANGGDDLVSNAVPADVTYGFPHRSNPGSIATVIAKGEAGYRRVTHKRKKLARIPAGQLLCGRGGI
jgi:hypothetical protein